MPPNLPGPWVDHEAREERPWANNDGIVKFMEFPVRISTMSRRAFHLYWQRHHSPSVMNATPFSQFMRKYNTAHIYPDPVPRLPGDYAQTTPFEGVSEVWINGLSEVAGWFGHPLYAELIQPDEKRFLRQDGSGEVIVVKEELLYAPDADMVESGLTKLYLLLRRRPGLGHDAFHSAISEHGKLLLTHPAFKRHVRKLSISHKLREPLSEPILLSDIDAVVELWFESCGDLGDFLDAPFYAVTVRSNEAKVADTGTIRALVAKVHVVHDEFSFQPSTMHPMPFHWDP